jgi:serine protease Do
LRLCVKTLLPGFGLGEPSLRLDPARKQGTLQVVLQLDPMTSKTASQLPRGRQAGWLLAVALSAAAWLAYAEPSPQISTRPAVPKVAEVLFTDLPPVFSKPAPTTLADLRVIQDHVAAMVIRVSPAVVAVEIGNGSGSGVIISSDGLVLTAGHVAEKPGAKVKFTFPDGKTARGKSLGLNAEADTGLMRITDPGPWPYVNVGEMNHTRLGDWALALGNPGGFDLKRSLVARLGRIIHLSPGQVQTDCTIYPGDSGGPLFDMYGRVIGIHSSISGSTAENYHVSITAFFATWEELIGPYSGLSVVEDDEGCRVANVEKDSPAAKADLKEGDRVLKVDGRHILSASVFEFWIAESRPGDTLQLDIERDGKPLSKSIKLESQADGAK